jgi:general secretion pathway protein G
MFGGILCDRKGYSLVELLVVVLILGLLAAIAVPQFMGRVGETRESATVADLKSMAGGIKAWAVDHDKYPSVAELPGALQESSITWSGSRDGWGNYLHYSVDDDGAGFILCSFGPNGVNDAVSDNVYTTDLYEPISNYGLITMLANNDQSD